MTGTILKTSSRRITPWTFDASATPLQAFIDNNIREAYEYRHPKLSDSEESTLFNSYAPEDCPHCGNNRFIGYGKTDNGLRKYRCRGCGRVFTAITGTIFQDHKIPVAEWIDFCLGLFRAQSFASISKSNRNSYTTTRYWVSKLFLILEGYQDSIVLRDEVWIDETFYKVRKCDIELRNDGKQYRGQSRNQMCIGIGCDKHATYAVMEGFGKTSRRKTLQAFEGHIAEKSHLIHDMEKSHGVLVEKLGLEDTPYDAKKLKGIPDDENPLNRINRKCNLLKRFLNAHSGFMRGDICGYLDLFSFMMNEGPDPYLQVERIMDIAMHCRKTLTFRENYAIECSN